MRFLLLIFLLSPICVNSDLLGEELEHEEHVRQRRQAHRAQHAQQISYRPLSQAPNQIKALLQSQLARDPLVHLPAQPPPQLGRAPSEPQVHSQSQVASYRPQVQFANPPQQPTYKNIPTGGGGGQYGGQQRAAPQPNYYQPQAAQQPQYSKNLPPHLQQLLQLQSQLPNPVPAGQGKAFQPAQQRVY